MSTTETPLARTCDCCTAAMVRIAPWLGVCPACGFLASDLAAGAGASVEGLENLRQANFERLLDRLETLRPLAGTRLLEVGCARGWFLDAAARRGVDCVGLEPDPDLAADAHGRGHSIETGLFPAAPHTKESFDIVVFNDSFEHIPAPRDAVARCAELLPTGGLLALNLPSSDGALYRAASVLARVGVRSPLERLWQKGLPSPHRSYFSPTNLTRLVESSGAFVPRERCALPSVAIPGLWRRLRSSWPVPHAVGLYIGVAAFVPLLRHLPQDIVLAIFERRSAPRPPLFGSRDSC